MSDYWDDFFKLKEEKKMERKFEVLKEKLIKEVREETAKEIFDKLTRSGWEMLPAYESKSNVNLIDSYTKGAKEMDEVWGRIITELRKEYTKT